MMLNFIWIYGQYDTQSRQHSPNTKTAAKSHVYTSDLIMSSLSFSGCWDVGSRWDLSMVKLIKAMPQTNPTRQRPTPMRRGDNHIIRISAPDQIQRQARRRRTVGRKTMKSTHSIHRYKSLSHELRNEGVREWASGARERNEQCGVNEWVSERTEELMPNGQILYASIL